MTDKLHCPFCGAELLGNMTTPYCPNPSCNHFRFPMASEIWQALIDGKKAQNMLKNSREKLAAFMHDTWADWFVYQFNNSTVENIQRWQIQSNLPYSSLMEEDKDKDRKFADKIISIITKQEE